MTKVKNRIAPRHIPLAEYRVAPLEGLNPTELVKAAKAARAKINGKPDLKSVKSKNLLVSKLGLKVRFAEYESYFEAELRPLRGKGHSKSFSSLSGITG